MAGEVELSACKITLNHHSNLPARLRFSVVTYQEGQSYSTRFNTINTNGKKETNFAPISCLAYTTSFRRFSKLSVGGWKAQLVETVPKQDGVIPLTCDGAMSGVMKIHKTSP